MANNRNNRPRVPNITVYQNYIFLSKLFQKSYKVYKPRGQFHIRNTPKRSRLFASQSAQLCSTCDKHSPFRENKENVFEFSKRLLRGPETVKGTPRIQHKLSLKFSFPSFLLNIHKLQQIRDAKFLVFIPEKSTRSARRTQWHRMNTYCGFYDLLCLRL